MRFRGKRAQPLAQLCQHSAPRRLEQDLLGDRIRSEHTPPRTQSDQQEARFLPRGQDA
jgi:hypothetical protein